MHLTESTTTKFISIGSAVVALAVWTAGTSDPVNVIKLWILGGVAIGVTLITIKPSIKQLIQDRFVLVCLTIFALATMLSTLTSEAPLIQNIYGVFGRNTGILAHVAFILMFLGVLTIKTPKNFQEIVNYFLISGLLNVVYCAWVIAFGDFIGWDNTYGNILGTFGNPDFISAFLGMFIVCASAVIFSKLYSKWFRILLLVAAPIAFFEILKSHAIQGIVVTVGGLALVGFWHIKNRFNSKWPWVSYIFITANIGALAILGALQTGPLNFIYKRSVSLRGSYWSAGIDMGKNHPISGVGFDTYGDWYRYSRPPQALVDTPDITVVTNVAHNVYIDYFASGGFPLLLSFAGLNLYILYLIVRVAFSKLKMDALYVAISATWICYQVQSLVSINQIGLSVWGWVLGGATLSYSKVLMSQQAEQEPVQKKRITNNNQVISPNLRGAVGVAIGLLIYFPVLNSDLIWGKAIRSRTIEDYEKALSPGLLNPLNTSRINLAVQTFASSNMPDLALKYAKFGVKFNENNYDGWRQIYFISTSTQSDKDEALKNLNRLDPKNPNVLDLN